MDVIRIEAIGQDKNKMAETGRGRFMIHAFLVCISARQTADADIWQDVKLLAKTHGITSAQSPH